MFFLLRDKYGFSHEVIAIQPETLNQIDAQRELDYFIKIRCIKNVTDFDVHGFQNYINKKYGITTMSVRPQVLNLRV